MLLIWVAGVQAQPFLRSVTSFPINDSAGPVAMPFLGGIDSPKPQLVDLDRDGDFDLVILQKDGRLVFFRNTGTLSSPQFDYGADSFLGINAGQWFRLADIDGDGDPDLFVDNNTGGMRFYRNDSPPDSFIFNKISQNFQNIFSGFNNTPAFADIDGDGDFDFFLGELTGTLTYWRNSGTPLSPNFVFGANDFDSIVAFPTVGCSVSVAPPPPGQLAEAQAHGINGIQFADLDGDGDFDFFWGDIFNTNMYFFRNQGTPLNSHLQAITCTFLPVSTIGFNEPAFADLDADGDPDLVVGSANFGSSIDNLLYFRNVGSPTAPRESLITRNLLSNLDFGANSYPAVVDWDGDGLPDLFCGRDDGRMAAYRNVGSQRHPAWQFVSSGFGGVDVGASSTPALGDLDGDGDLDMICGNEDGRLALFRNTGTPSNPVFTLTDGFFLGLDLDFNASPVLVDIDHDGDLDLFVGEWDNQANANLYFYRNEGGPFPPNFVQEATALLPPTGLQQTLPAFADIDGDGDYDLFLGTSDGTIWFYRNSGDSTTFNFVKETENFENIDVGQTAAPFLVDIDYDGDPDLVAGESDGGLNLYCNQALAVGDVTRDGVVDISDLVSLIQRVVFGALLATPDATGDLNCDGVLDIIDIVALVQNVVFGAPPPCI